MELLFMFCNDCMSKIFIRHWLVDNHKCTCIFLEEQNLNLTRRTYWANGLVTDREMSIEMSKSLDFVDEQSRRVKNGPGIKCVKIYDSRNR